MQCTEVLITSADKCVVSTSAVLVPRSSEVFNVVLVFKIVCMDLVDHLVDVTWCVYIPQSSSWEWLIMT